MKTFQCQQKSFFEDPILTPIQPYSHCSQRQFTNVTNCTKFVTFLRMGFTVKLKKHNEFAVKCFARFMKQTDQKNTQETNEPSTE